MKKSLLKATSALLATAMLAGCGSASSTTTTEASQATSTTASASSDDALKVGVCLVQSGALGGIVDYLIPPIEFAFDKINEEGGINGRQVELVMRDDQGDTSMVAQRLSELKAEGCDVIIGPLLDTQAPAAAQWAGENQIPTILCCTMATDVSIENYNDYVFCTGPSAWAEARVLEEYVIANDIKSVYFVGSVGGVVEDNYNFFADEIKEKKPDVEILGCQMVQMTDTDFQSIINDIRAKSPDLVAFDSGAQAANFLQQGIQFDLFSDVHTFGFDLLSPAATSGFGKDFPTSISSVTWSPAFNGNAMMDELTQAMQERTGQEIYPMSLTVQCYNAALAAIEALKKIDGDVTPDAVTAALSGLSFESPIGTCSFREFDHQLVFPLAYSDAVYDDTHDFAVEGNLVYMDDSVWPTQEELQAYAQK